MSVIVDSKRPLHLVLGLLATVSMCWTASAEERHYEPFKWHTPSASDPILPWAPARGAAEFEFKWSFINWVATVASSKPQEAASIVSSALDVDLTTATELIGFSAASMSRLKELTSDRREFCDSLRAAKTEQAFASAIDAQSLRWDRTRAEIVGDLDSLFAGPTAAKIHTWIEANIQPSEGQSEIGWHQMFATPAAREGVIDRVCGPAAK